MKVIICPNKSDIFSQILQGLQKFAGEINFNFSNDELYIQAMDASHCSIFDMKINKEWFEFFEVNEDVTLGVNVSIMYRIFHTRESSQKIVLEFEENSDKDYCNSLLMAKPLDVHSRTAEKISAIIGKDFKRSPAKSVKYAATYGATAGKIAKTIGDTLQVGNQVYNAFWEAAKPLKELKDQLAEEWEDLYSTKFIVGIDNRKVPTRSPHAILNSLFQSAGVISAKRAAVIHEKLLKEHNLYVDFFKDDWKSKIYCQQLCMYHDEAQLEVSKTLAKFKVFRLPDTSGLTEDEIKIVKKKVEKECEDWKTMYEEKTGEIWSDVSHTDTAYFVGYSLAGELAAKAVKLAGEYYNLNVGLTAGYILGRSWRDCH